MNNNGFFLSASLISSNLSDVGLTIRGLKKGKIDFIHFDVMDGIFVPRFGLPLELLTAVRADTKIPICVHAMTTNLEKYLDTIADAGTDCLTFNIEATNHADRIIDLIHKKGMRAGIALNPATPLVVLDYILNKIDIVTLMAINPGIPKHPFIASTYKKLSELKNKTSSYQNIKIEIDGGINEKTAVNVIKHGADILVCGSHSIFSGKGNLSQRIIRFRKNIAKRL